VPVGVLGLFGSAGICRVCTADGRCNSDRIAVRWESRLNCRISETPNCAEKLWGVLSTRSVPDRESSGCRSRASEDWHLRVEGPNSFERSYTLAGSAVEHEPEGD